MPLLAFLSLLAAGVSPCRGVPFVTASEGDRELLHAVDDRVTEPQALEGDGEAEAREPVEDLGEDRLQLHASECLAKALVDAVTERHVTARVPGDVEAPGFGEHLRVVVRRDER